MSESWLRVKSWLQVGKIAQLFDVIVPFCGCPSDEYELVCTCDKWLRIEGGYYA